ncbi:MAG: hypothetical protein AAFP70_06375 [Calditrichota bacterium]
MRAKERLKRIYHTNLHYAVSARAAELESARYYDFNRGKRNFMYMALYTLALQLLFLYQPQLLTAPVLFTAIAVPLFAVFFVATMNDSDQWHTVKWLLTVFGITAYVCLRAAAPDSFLYQIFSGSLVQGIALTVDALVLIYLVCINLSLIRQGLKSRVFDANEEGLSEFVEVRDLVLIGCFTSFALATTSILAYLLLLMIPQDFIIAFDVPAVQPLIAFYSEHIVDIFRTIAISLFIIGSIRLSECTFPESPKVFQIMRKEVMTNDSSVFNQLIAIGAAIYFSLLSVWHWIELVLINIGKTIRDTSKEMFNIYGQLLFTWLIGTVLPPLFMVLACNLLLDLSVQLAEYLQQPAGIFTATQFWPSIGMVFWTAAAFTTALGVTAIAMSISRVHVKYNRFFQMLVLPQQVKSELRAVLQPAQTIWTLALLLSISQISLFTAFQFTKADFTIGAFFTAVIVLFFTVFLSRNNESLQRFKEAYEAYQQQAEELKNQPAETNYLEDATLKEQTGDSSENLAAENPPESTIPPKDVSDVEAIPVAAAGQPSANTGGL